MPSITITVERDDQPVDVEVEYQYARGMKAPRDTIVRRGDGPPLAPDDEPEVEIIGSSIPLTDAEEHRAEDKIWDIINDR